MDGLDLNADVGVRHPEPDQLVRQGVLAVGIGGANGDEAPFVFPHLLQAASGLLQKPEIHLGLLRQELPLRGKLQPLWGPLHNGHIKLRLNVLQALGQGGLGDVENVGNLGQVGIFVKLVEKLPVKVFHSVAILSR